MLKLADIADIAGFGPVLRKRIKTTFPKEEWRDNPYCLTEVHGIGFVKADAVALQLGIAKDAKERISAGAAWVLSQAEMEGHTVLPLQIFGEGLSSALNTSLPDDLDLDGDFEVDAGLIARGRTAKAERTVAAIIQSMMREREPLPAFAMEGLKNDQRQAVEAIRYFPVFTLLGGPGVGKTHTIRTLIEGSKDSIALCAPTGKAAKRIEELSGQRAQTIHRLLGVLKFGGTPAHSPGFKFEYNRYNTLPYDMVIADESSMIDIRLMADLCEALNPDARLLLVGDPFQLPAVGPGAVLRDLTQTRQGRWANGPGGAPFFELTELKRQDPDKLIARNCQAIRYEHRVIVDNAKASDFFFAPIPDARRAADEIVKLVIERLPKKYGLDPTRDITVLAALRDKGELSVKALNTRLRAVLNPDAGAARWAVGDRVIQTSNNYKFDMMNGDLGTICEITLLGMSVEFDTPQRIVKAPNDEFDLLHAYALTVHRFQGSENRAVVVAIHEEQGQMVVHANSIYTAISRARELCVMVGSRAALDGAAARHREVARWTRLASLLS